MKPRELVLCIFAVLLLILGTLVCFYPVIYREQQKTQAGQTVRRFLQEHEPQLSPLPVAEVTEPQGNTEVQYSELFQAMQAYNAEIYANGQAGLSDPWAYTSEVIDLSAYGLDSEVVAVLTIPAMELQEPVYLGATAAHLNNGLAQLSVSSMPIGGKNSNCVIAGHRGWDGALFFRDIEILQEGDEVELTNLWETLRYKVVEIKIIQPYEAERILIQPGRDLLTLLTCHPYGSGGKLRYIVYCERVP